MLTNDTSDSSMSFVRTVETILLELLESHAGDSNASVIRINI